MTDDLTRLQNMPPMDSVASPFDLAEFQILQQFYKAWEALHAIPNDRFHKKQKEAAATKLVEKAHILRRMASDRQIVLVPRFQH